MNEHNENYEALTPDLAALDAGLAELGAAERAGAPSELEGRIIAATSGVVVSNARKPLALAGKSDAPARTGVLGRLSVKRLDWPMRVAAVIAVMIGGWAVFNGVNGPKPAAPSFNPDEVFDYVFGKTGTAEQIQNLLGEVSDLEMLIGGGEHEPEIGDQESL